MARRWALLGLALFLGACHNAVDEAAKRRIFSPQNPPRFVTRAADNLDARHLDRSPEHIRRVFTMSAREAEERLGPHQLKSTLTFHWKLGEKKVALDEVHTLTLGRDGNFAARLDDGDRLGDSPQGMEMIRAQGRVYACNRFQKFRERDRDRGAAARYEERVYDVLGTVYRLFDGRVALAPGGETEVAGRQAYRFKVFLAQKNPTLKQEGPTLPPLQGPKTGLGAHLKRELALDRHKKPQSLEGTITVDAKTAVALQADITGTLTAPGGRVPATLRLHVTQDVSRVSDDITVLPPKHPLPDEGRPRSIVAALKRFGLPHQGEVDGGR